jgi:hypothetical protein
MVASTQQGCELELCAATQHHRSLTNARSDTAARNMATNLVTVKLRIAARRRQQPSRHIYVTGRARHQQR